MFTLAVVLGVLLSGYSLAKVFSYRGGPEALYVMNFPTVAFAGVFYAAGATIFVWPAWSHGMPWCAFGFPFVSLLLNFMCWEIPLPRLNSRWCEKNFYIVYFGKVVKCGEEGLPKSRLVRLLDYFNLLHCYQAFAIRHGLVTVNGEALKYKLSFMARGPMIEAEFKADASDCRADFEAEARSLMEEYGKKGAIKKMQQRGRMRRQPNMDMFIDYLS